jgi:hypothetical protein
MNTISAQSKFDLILFSSTKPRVPLQRVVGALKPGGVIVMECGDEFAPERNGLLHQFDLQIVRYEIALDKAYWPDERKPRFIVSWPRSHSGIALIDGGSAILGGMSRLGSRGRAEVIHMSELSPILRLAAQGRPTRNRHLAALSFLSDTSTPGSRDISELPLAEVETTSLTRCTEVQCVLRTLSGIASSLLTVRSY